MADREKTIKNLESIVELCKIKQMDCKIGCDSREMFADFARDINEGIVLLKEQEEIIERYRRADGFLAAHGWKWEGR